MSEFMVMAATLLDIKCRMLLPKEINEEGEEEDPRAELVQKLLEYKMYKYMSYELKDKMDDASGVYFREPDVPREVLQYREPVDPSELLAGLTLEKLNAITSRSSAAGRQTGPYPKSVWKNREGRSQSF